MPDPVKYARIATVLIVIVVVIVGGVIALLTATGTIHDPDAKLTFSGYIRDVGLALGLLAVGLGLDPHSRP
jgi:uncharacterized ion transporter superfamily protein YfcC